MSAPRECGDHFKRMGQIARLGEKFPLHPNHRVGGNHDGLRVGGRNGSPLATRVFYGEKFRPAAMVLSLIGPGNQNLEIPPGFAHQIHATR